MRYININKLKYKFATYLLAIMLIVTNYKFWIGYGTELKIKILEHPPLFIGWILINMFVLFMVALHFNDFIYRITNGKPHLWGAAIFALYAIIREWAYPISTIGTTVVVIVLFLTYAIRQTTFSLYVYKHRQYDQKRAKRESEKQKNALAVDNANTVDPILEEVAIFMVKTERCYVADIQRKFEVGYNRAQRIMTQLERAEITTTRVNNQPRTLLVTSEKEVGERISKLKLRLKSESNIE